MARLITQFPLDTRLASWLEAAWLQRYLERRLDAEETAWFEAYVMDKPVLLERLERDTDLRDGLASASRDAGMEAAAQPTDTDETDAEEDMLPQRTRRRRSRAIEAFALAASLLVGVGVGWFSRRPPLPDDAIALIASPTRIVFDAERGAPSAPRIDHAGSQSPWVLVEIAVPPGARQVSVQVENSGQLQLPPSAEGFVTFLARRDARKAGRVVKLAYVLDGSPQTRSFMLDEARGEAKP
jgi:hypothetical protein